MGDKIRLHTGLYRCPRCGTEYDCIRLYAQDLACQECGEELKSVNPLEVWIRRYPNSLLIRNTPRRTAR